MANNSSISKAAAGAGILAVGILMVVGVVATASPTDEGAVSREIWVEVTDAQGRVVDAEARLRFEVREDNRVYTAQDLGTVTGRWRVVLYFDQLLAKPLDFRNGTLELADRARELSRLGPVEIVLAGREVRTALPPTRDADALGQALAWLRLRESAGNEQAALRRELVRSLGLDPTASEGGQPTAALAEREGIVAAVVEAMSREAALLRDHRERLLSWAVDRKAPGPQVIFLIGSGFDADPAVFYRSILSEAGLASEAEELVPPQIVPSVDELGRVLSAYGWVAMPFVPAVRGDLLLEGTEDAQGGTELREIILQDGQEVDRTTIGFDPRKLLRGRQRDEQPEGKPMLVDPLATFGQLADATGGEVVTGQLQLPDLLERLPRRRRVVYQLGPGGRTGWRRREVVALSEDKAEPLAVQAPSWTSDFTPEVVAAVRARRFLYDEIDEGELPIDAAVRSFESGEASRLLVQLDTPIALPTAAALRVTVVAADSEDRVRLTHELRTLDNQHDGEELDLDNLILEIELAEKPEGPIAVLVEELDTGRWGAAFASELAAGGMLAAADDAGALILPGPKAIHLLSPRSPFSMGRTTLETVVSESEVRRVEFLLDGKRQAAVSVPPFTASLDLGPLPHPRRVDVVAFDEAGRELGRDYLILNEGSGIFGVRIVEPQPNEVGSGDQSLVGPVDVEAEVEPRRGEGIDRVEFFWKETLVATRFAPPYRQRVVIPAAEPKGFIRVVAYLEDGASSEDVVFVNSPGSSERVQVNLIELYVVVSDRQRRPVKGLRREDFRLSEAGEPQQIATFSQAGDLPLTVGLAIDSSASMFVKLPQVQFAAAEFIRGLATRRDRAFVVGFGSEPRLAGTTTSDLPRVIHDLGGLQPDGQTAIWKAIVYSLVQLQGVPGKKALIVYSDGADEDPDFSFRTCLRFARKVGVPIYVIVSNNEIVRTEGRGLNVRGFLGRLQSLVDSVGGRLFMSRVGEDLEGVYRQIEEELRSQYLLGYYSADFGGREWREVKVDVRRLGHKARTIAGYFR